MEKVNLFKFTLTGLMMKLFVASLFFILLVLMSCSHKEKLPFSRADEAPTLSQSSNKDSSYRRASEMQGSAFSTVGVHIPVVEEDFFPAGGAAHQTRRTHTEEPTFGLSGCFRKRWK